jgi:hypothetical protein
MATKTKADHVQPIQPAAFIHEGSPVVINPHEIFDRNHPYVKARPKLFKPVEASRQRPAVEQMTAAPGEMRG